MNGEERREKIVKMLTTGSKPIPGVALAKQFDVSRQVIVQDMALIRAEHHDIISTNRGYLINAPQRVTRAMKVFHSDEDMEDELNTIVDLGGVALDVFVRHRVYGCLRAELNVSSRRDVKKFLEEIHSGKSTPLKDVTSGYHYHTISADSEDTLNLIEQELNNKGYLCQN